MRLSNKQIISLLSLLCAFLMFYPYTSSFAAEIFYSLHAGGVDVEMSVMDRFHSCTREPENSSPLLADRDIDVEELRTNMSVLDAFFVGIDPDNKDSIWVISKELSLFTEYGYSFDKPVPDSLLEGYYSGLSIGLGTHSTYKGSKYTFHVYEAPDQIRYAMILGVWNVILRYVPGDGQVDQQDHKLLQGIADSLQVMPKQGPKVEKDSGVFSEDSTRNSGNGNYIKSLGMRVTWPSLSVAITADAVHDPFSMESIMKSEYSKLQSVVESGHVDAICMVISPSDPVVITISNEDMSIVNSLLNTLDEAEKLDLLVSLLLDSQSDEINGTVEKRSIACTNGGFLSTIQTGNEKRELAYFAYRNGRLIVIEVLPIANELTDQMIAFGDEFISTVVFE